ncbi:MAG: hypothetical protein D6729_12870 [Deltaproteobacteria bacterium]|nr:MAG: hypothetical protein D6729_12870 [Deltaproteobacteria bacterium]
MQHTGRVLGALVSALTVGLTSPGAASAADSAAASKLQRVAVLDVEGSGAPPEVYRALTEALGSEISRREGFTAVTGGDISQILSLEAQRQLLGADANSDLSAVADLLDVDRLLRTQATRIGERWILVGSLVDPRRGEVVNRASESVTGDVGAVMERLPAFVSTLLSIPARLELAGQVEGAKIFVDDALVATLPAGPIPLSRSGEVSVRAEASDHLPFAATVTLTPGRTTRLRLDMPSFEALEAASARRQAWAVGAGAGGVALAALGGLAAREGWTLYGRYQALDARRTTQAEFDALAEQSRTYLGLGYAGLAAGAALLATGVYLFFVDPDAARLEVAGAGGGIHVAIP